MAKWEEIAEEMEAWWIVENENGDYLEVEMEDYILEVDLKDLEGLELVREDIAKVIAEKYIY